MTGEGSDDSCENGGCTTRDGGATPSDSEQFRLGDVVEMLSHPARREVLSHLATCDAEVSLEELVEEIGPDFVLVDPLRRSDKQHERVKLQLYHVHLPKLDRNGMIEFDRQDLTVAITEDGRDALRKWP